MITCFTHLSRSKPYTYKFSTIADSYVSRPMKSRDQPCMIMYPTRHTSLVSAPVRAEGQWRLDARSPSNAHSRTHCNASNHSITYHVFSQAMQWRVPIVDLCWAHCLEGQAALSDCPFRQPQRIIMDKFHLQSGDTYRTEFASTLSCIASAVSPPGLMPD